MPDDVLVLESDSSSSASDVEIVEEEPGVKALSSDSDDDSVGHMSKASRESSDLEPFTIPPADYSDLVQPERSFEELLKEKDTPLPAREWLPDLGDFISNRHDVAFFPFSHLPGLDYLRSVFATCGGGQVDLIQIRDRPGAASSTLQDRVDESGIATQHVGCWQSPWDQDDEDPEQFYTLAWTVNLATFPPTPVLAVAGRKSLIDMIHIKRSGSGSLLLEHERTIVHHGRPIMDLHVSPTRPHLLISSSLDRSVCLWDPFVRKGSNAEVLKRMKNPDGPRPRVTGELLGVLSVEGHTRGVFSSSLHPTVPLLVTSSADGFIKIWRIPDHLLGPSITDSPPLAPLSTLRQRSPLFIGPPLFSSPSIHPGTTADQVAWLSPLNLLIVSKADHVQPPLPGMAAEKAEKHRRTTKAVKIWRPLLEPGEEPLAAGSGAGPKVEQQDGASVAISMSDKQLAFWMYGEMEFDERNFLGDKIGIHLQPACRRGCPDLLVAVPTLKSTLDIFSPFEPLGKAGEDTIEDHFPDDRDRLRRPFTSEILPFQVSDLQRGVHLRSVAFSDGGQWIAGVGDKGVVTYWRGRYLLELEATMQQMTI
ncbi:polycomb protein EED [Pseudohyphozyma bogoriensis]|nr:polycomb protein EED [Pseudohyphozyma bogoriensis]